MNAHTLAVVAIIVASLVLWATAGWARATLADVRGPDMLAQQCTLMEASSTQRQELLNMGFSELELLDRSRLVRDRHTGLPTVSYMISSAEVEIAAAELLGRLADAYGHSLGVEPVAAGYVATARPQIGLSS